MSELDAILHEQGASAIERMTDDTLSELSAAVLSERQSRGGRGPETRLDSMIQIAALDWRRLDREVQERAGHLGEAAMQTAATSVARGGVRAYGSEGAWLDELVTKRGEVWERYRTLVYARDGEFPEEVADDE